jgi:hypothetical protein
MSPKDDQTSLGNILVNMGAITQEQLDKIIEEQKMSPLDVLMGKLLVADGYVAEHQLAAAMEVQQGLRTASKYQRAMIMSQIAVRTSQRLVASAEMTGGKLGQILKECVQKKSNGKSRGNGAG